VGGSCGDGNEPSGSMKGGIFLDHRNEFWLLRKESVPWSSVIYNFKIPNIDNLDFKRYFRLISESVRSAALLQN